jgi:adenosylcobinamide-phosphate synthase
LAGLLALGIILAAAAVPAILVQATASLLLSAILASSLLASRSLAQHVAAVADGLRQGLPEARAAVSHIVGRDPEALDAHAVARAAIESLAENFADGVVAPAFWGCVAGLPGMAVYKAANTADSMIGHRTPRHARFGWAAARFDDLVNLPASRLAALWLILAATLTPGAHPVQSVRAVFRDAGKHRSPNAGWPEAAMAGALGLSLNGPRSYAGTRVADAWMGHGRATATAADIDAALRLYRRACALQIAAITALALMLPG